MKRPRYRITQVGGPDEPTIKYSWNSALRETGNLVREHLAPGETAERTHCEREDLDRWTTRRGLVHWTTSGGLTLAYRIELEETP